MSARAHRLLTVTCGVLLGVCSSTPAEDKSVEPEQHGLAPPTHQQVRTITPMRAGQSLMLHTFCLHPDGDLLLCCSSRSANRTVSAGGVLGALFSGGKRQATPGWVLVYSPEGEQRRSISLDFIPTAINLSPDGECFVAGSGRVAKLDVLGENVIATYTTPNIQDMETFKKEVEAGIREQYRRRAESYSQQAATLRDRIESITDIEEGERTEQQEKLLANYRKNLQRYESMVEQMRRAAAGPINVDSMVKSKLRVTGLAVSDRDVFLSCSATTGYGYDIWRADHDLQNAEVVIKGARGCCGQMDIQCCGEDLLVAENTKFVVATYGRDGQQKSSFGGRDRESVDGFGSCCNPMNVRTTPDGAILTAESSIGHIKKFDTQGNLLAYIGKAEIGGGCKHCALGYDEKRDRYYMQHEDAHHICVLVPAGEAAESAQEEGEVEIDAGERDK